MSAAASDHRKGLAIALLGGAALTLDIPLIRLADGTAWSIVLLRSGSTVLALTLVWTLLRATGRNPPAIVPGRTGIAVASLYAISSLCFMLAVFHTSTANLVFILAFNTAFAALLGWLIFGERPRWQTLAAIAAMILGVGIIVGDGLGQGNLFGDLMAMTAALAIALALALSRRSGRDMGFAALAATAPVFLVGAFMVSTTGFAMAEPGWILLNGLLVIPVAFFCLANAPKYLAAPEVAMFYLLETVFAPIWVWLIFNEAPTSASLLGGAILIVALVAHSAWQLIDGRRRAAALAVRHPA